MGALKKKTLTAMKVRKQAFSNVNVSSVIIRADALRAIRNHCRCIVSQSMRMRVGSAASVLK